MEILAVNVTLSTCVYDLWYILLFSLCLVFHAIADFTAVWMIVLSTQKMAINFNELLCTSTTRPRSMSFCTMLAGVQLNSLLVMVFTDSMCGHQGALGNLNACLWKEGNQGELLRWSILLDVLFTLSCVSNPPLPPCSEMRGLLGNLQTPPAAPQLLISEALLSVCGFQPWGSQSWEGWLLFQTLLGKWLISFLHVYLIINMCVNSASMYIHNKCALLFKSVAESPSRSGWNRV